MICKLSRVPTPTTLEKVESKTRRADSRVSLFDLMCILGMIRQTTEQRASTMAKESIDIMLINLTSSYMLQLSMKDE
jgi:hypothetical protein